MRKLYKLLIILSLFAPGVSKAQNICAGLALGQCVSKVYLIALGAAGILAVLMSIIGGFMVMTARGNAQQAANGKSYLTSSIIGLILLLGAYVILNTINPDLVDFSWNSNPADY
jgi:hypothetical protein